MLTQHARYHPQLYEKYFPEETKYTASIRDPTKWFISSVDYMACFRGYDPHEVLAQLNLFHEPRPLLTGLQQKVHNTFLQWLGLDVDQTYNETRILEYIAYLDKKFDLIMITEYFDESLVLLKRLMNWSITDIIYSYANEGKRKSNTVLSDSEVRKLLDINHNRGDWLLYQHFNKTLWKKIELEKDFFEEVDLYRKVRAETQKFCEGNEFELMNRHTYSLKFTSKWEGGITITESNCVGMRVKGGHAKEMNLMLDMYAPFRKSRGKKPQPSELPPSENQPSLGGPQRGHFLSQRQRGWDRRRRRSRYLEHKNGKRGMEPPILSRPSVADNEGQQNRREWIPWNDVH